MDTSLSDFQKLEAAEAECEALRAELAEANAETEAAQNETIHLRDAMNGSCALRDAAEARAECERLRVDNDAAEGYITQLTEWIIEADAAFNVGGKPAKTLDDCLGLVRMCHEGAAALHEVERLRAMVNVARGLLSKAAPIIGEYDWLDKRAEFLRSTEELCSV
jgi:uncharacterized protein YfaT (DUF1175 family)